MAVFEIISRLEKKIRLTDVSWVHIQLKHPELNNQLSKIEETLERPDWVYYCANEENYQHYKYFAETPVTEKYILVVVKHLNKEGFVITAFFVTQINKAGKEVVCGKENFHQLR